MLLTVLVASALCTIAAPGFPHGTGNPGPLSAHRASRTRPVPDDTVDVLLYARLLQSADQRVLDTVLIATALSSAEPEIRRVAARTLSQVALRHRRRALPLLRALTGDADSVVASAAIFGLGLVRDTASVSLLASSARRSGATAAAAAWSLGEVGAPAREAIAALLGQLGAAGRESSSQSALLVAESKLRPVDVAAVTPYLHSPDTTVRWAAGYALARQRAPAGVSPLLDAPAPNAILRAEVARILTRDAAGDTLRGRALARLRALIDDTDPYVRINALRSLATFGDTARAAVLHALRDRDANVRVAAAQSAGTALGSGGAVWREAWATDTGYKVRKSLLASSQFAGYELPAEREWRSSPDWRLRHAAVESWSASHDTAAARRTALALVGDPDARVRGAAYAVLAASDTARRDSVVQRALALARSDPDSVVRNSVPGTRARPLDTAAVERPLDFYSRAVRRIVIPALRGYPQHATIRTSRGAIVLTLNGVEAPLTVLNFLTLAQRHAYDGLRFHRVVPGFVAQDGDPRGDGEGGPGYAIRDELTLLPYTRGAVGMALSGPDTGGSQYFLTLTPQPHLTGHYTVFGYVSTGFSAMDALVEGDAINTIVPRW